MLTKEAAQALRVRLLYAMSMGEAKEVLGFPPSANPSPQEVIKAYRAKAMENHPDRGGDPRKMVEVNVALEILQGKRTDDRTEVTRDPEEVAKKQREADARIIRSALLKGVEAMQSGIQEVASIRLEWTLDLRSYLSDEYSDNLDTLQEAAEKALKDKDLDGKTREEWKRIERAAESVGAMALRMGSKLKTLWKKLDALKLEKRMQQKTTVTPVFTIRWSVI